MQVAGGLHGLLIVEPASSYKLPKDLESLYQQETQEMVLHHYNFGPNDVGNEPHVFKSYPSISAQYKEKQSIEPNFKLSTSVKSFFAVNGIYHPTVSIKTNQATLFRMVNSATHRFIELELSSINCEMKLIARDGIFQYTPYQTVNAIVLAPGSRSDVAILCTKS